MKAEAYKAGDVESGNWHWAVGIKSDLGIYSQIAAINAVACYRRDLDDHRIAVIMADALNSELEKT